MAADVEQRVKSVIKSKIDVEDSKLQLEAGLVNDLGADSLTLVAIGMELEAEFSVEISDPDCERFTTIRDIVNYMSIRT